MEIAHSAGIDLCEHVVDDRARFSNGASHTIDDPVVTEILAVAVSRF